MNRPIVYLSFDRFPSAKGAATHINAFATALGEHFGNVSLLTIPSEQHSRTQLHLPELAEPAQPIRKWEFGNAMEFRRQPLLEFRRGRSPPRGLFHVLGCIP